MLRSHEHRVLWYASATNTSNCRCVKTEHSLYWLDKGGFTYHTVEDGRGVAISLSSHDGEAC